MELEQQDDTDLRAAALLALGKNGAPEAIKRLQAVAADPDEARPMRAQAIRALGHTGSEPVVEFLTQLAKQEPSLVNPVYAALDRLASPLALSFLERGLTQQVQRHQRWRKHRSTWREEFNDEKLLDEDQKLKAEKDAWD